MNIKVHIMLKLCINYKALVNTRYLFIKCLNIYYYYNVIKIIRNMNRSVCEFFFQAVFPEI